MDMIDDHVVESGSQFPAELSKNIESEPDRFAVVIGDRGEPGSVIRERESARAEYAVHESLLAQLIEDGRACRTQSNVEIAIHQHRPLFGDPSFSPGHGAFNQVWTAGQTAVGRGLCGFCVEVETGLRAGRGRRCRKDLFFRDLAGRGAEI